jgi:hypothetical protein
MNIFSPAHQDSRKIIPTTPEAVLLWICDGLRSSPVRRWRGAIAYRTAFVHPSIDLAPKVVDEQRRFDRFAIRISRIRSFGLDFSARLILLYQRLICHGSPLHDHR